MKARPEDQLLLLDLQAHDNHIAQCRHQASHIAEQAQLDVIDGQLREFSQRLLAAHAELEEANLELSRLEDDVKVVDQRMAKDREREQNSSSVKDVQALEHEIETLAARKEALEDAELIIMEKVETAQKCVDEIAVERDALQAKRSEIHAIVQAKGGDVLAELEREQAARAELAARIPIELLDLYEKQRSRYGIGAALLTRRISGGSGVELTSTDLDAIRHAADDDVVICPDSSCILIRTSESGL